MTAYGNYLDDARALEDALRKDGLAERADLIRSAIDLSSTGTEICMALLFIVENLLGDSSNPLTPHAEHQSRKLLHDLEAVLQ